MLTSSFFDLEVPADQAALQSPMLALGDLKGLVILDEVQLAPALFPFLRERRTRRRRHNSPNRGRAESSAMDSVRLV